MNSNRPATWILRAAITAAMALLAQAALAAKPTADQPRPAIELGAPFADNAVLQRQMPVPVWGWSKPGTMVTVSFAGQSKTAEAGEGGKWMVKLEPLKASADPREMVVTDSAGKKVTLKNILVGEVWMASGQSNMQWVASKSSCRVLIEKLSEKAKANGREMPPIREGKVTSAASSLHPIEHAEGEWTTDMGNFSAIALAFALELREELKVPVGILNCAFSTTQIEAWIPREGFAGGKDDYTREVYQRILEGDPTTPEHKKAWDKYYRELEQTLAENEKLVKAGKEAKEVSTKTPGNLRGNRDACWMYNAKINPMIPYAIRGAIWNQGYASQGGGLTYYHNLHSLVRGWRAVWGRPDLPVYFHQFYSAGANDGLTLSSTAEMRMGTCLARDIPNANMASQIDITGSVHYYNKAVPGQRLARHALKNQYGKDIVADGPIFKSYRVEGDKLIVQFDHAEGGLVVGETGTEASPRTGAGLANPTVIPDGADKVTLFYIADADRVWHRAKVKIDGEKVVLTAPGVAKPRGVSYAWNGVGSQPNLYNRALLPMTPFIYYDHKMVTRADWPDDSITVAGVTPDPAGGGLLYEYRKMPILSTQFRDNAVIQADAPVTFWGSAVHDWGYEAEGDAVIKFRFGGIEKTIPVEPGMQEWRVTVGPMKASAEPKTLKVSLEIDGELAHERTAENIVVGDVWYVAAPFDQKAGKKGDGAVRVMTRKAKRSMFRNPSRYSICVSTTPGNRFASVWANAEGGLAGSLGKRISAKTGGPVGVIFMNGRAPHMVDGKNRGRDLDLKHWIAFDGLKHAPSLMEDYEDLAAIKPGTPFYNANVHRYIGAWKKYWSESVPTLMKTKQTMNGAAWGTYPSLSGSVSSDATQAYNTMVHSFGPGCFKGIIFLCSEGMFEKDQGSNYGPELSALANSWKRHFAAGENAPDPCFFYTIPSKKLAPKITRPEGIKGKSAAMEIDRWPGSEGDDEQLSKLIDQVINAAYK